MLWLVLVLIGFLVLVALVIKLGTRSTNLYEQARHGTGRRRPAPTVDRWRPNHLTGEPDRGPHA